MMVIVPVYCSWCNIIYFFENVNKCLKFSGLSQIILIGEKKQEKVFTSRELKMCL